MHRRFSDARELLRRRAISSESGHTLNDRHDVRGEPEFSVCRKTID